MKNEYPAHHDLAYKLSSWQSFGGNEVTFKTDEIMASQIIQEFNLLKSKLDLAVGALHRLSRAEPEIHSNISDDLPDNHPLANKTVNCSSCEVMLHAFNNECMQTWIETGQGNYCVKCFSKIGEVLTDDMALDRYKNVQNALQQINNKSGREDE